MQAILKKNALDTFNVKKFRKMNSTLMSQHVQSLLLSFAQAPLWRGACTLSYSVRKHVLNRNPKKLACKCALHHEHHTVIHSVVLPPSRSTWYYNYISRMEKVTENHIQWSWFPPKALNSHNQFRRYRCTSHRLQQTPSRRNSKHVPLFIGFWWNAFELEPGKAQMWINLGNRCDEWGKKKACFFDTKSSCF